MSPYIHAQKSVERWGGTIEQFLPIHKKMDCSKGYFSDLRHRALTHQMFWVLEVMVPLFGETITVRTENGTNEVSVKDICEQHILEDFRGQYIPNVQDYLENMDYVGWMENGKMGIPSSYRKVHLTKQLLDISNEQKEEIKKELEPMSTNEVTDLLDKIKTGKTLFPPIPIKKIVPRSPRDWGNQTMD